MKVLVTLVIALSLMLQGASLYAKDRLEHEFDYEAFAEERSTYMDSADMEDEEGDFEDQFDYSADDEIDEFEQELIEDAALSASDMGEKDFESVESESDVSQADQQDYDALIDDFLSKESPEQ